MRLCKGLPCILMFLSILIYVLIINARLIKSFLRINIFRTETFLRRQTITNIKNKLNTILSYEVINLNHSTVNIFSNQSEQLLLPADELLVSSDYTLSFERKNGCNLQTPNNCLRTNKSLVISFWSEKSSQRWLPSHLLSTFPEKYFGYIIMVHDASCWTNHPAYDKIIWIHFKSQIRFWYIKRFISPHIFRAYRYIWVVDDDARFHFDTREYECIVDIHNISLSAPGRGEGTTIHRITRVSPKYRKRLGRWTDFIEIGPLFIATSSAWLCLWNYLSEKVGLGYGLDNIWCGVLSTCLKKTTNSKTCAILDAFVVHHNSSGINTVQAGGAEMPAYEKYYDNYWAKMLVFGPLASNSKDLHICASKLSKDLI